MSADVVRELRLLYDPGRVAIWLSHRLGLPVYECVVCGAPVSQKRMGRPRVYCSQRCVSRAFRARLRSA